MFFSSRKKKRLAEAQAQEQEQARLKQEAAIQEASAYTKNAKTFYRICDMARSLPKERQIVVVQRKNTFKDNYARSLAYMKTAREMRRQYQLNGNKWISAYNDSLYAFYLPTKVNFQFTRALLKFSKGGYLIQRIRYYHFDY
ncbi:MAG: hypothetical protein IJE68_02155 [Clostridia bacterium]|nr:hypothetical protein [Clostridia bacterium]